MSSEDPAGPSESQEEPGASRGQEEPVGARRRPKTLGSGNAAAIPLGKPRARSGGLEWGL